MQLAGLVPLSLAGVSVHTRWAHLQKHPNPFKGRGSAICIELRYVYK